MMMNIGGSSARAVGLARDKEGEYGTRAGGQQDAPDEGRQARRLRVRVHAALHQGPQIDRDDGVHAGVEDHVPAEHRSRVEVGRGDHQAVGAAEVEHDHGQAAAQHGDAEQGGERRARLVGLLAEHRAD
jgi:hypothetical protein